ncbi:MAG: glycine oxidase ThiO, partial [Actinomycetota bacterium]
MESPDTIVVGAGVIGLGIGWRAACLGLSVLVVERARAGKGASWVSAGMLAPITEAYFGEGALLALNLESARRYPSFLAELAEAGGSPVTPIAPGTLFVALDRDQLEALRRLYDFQRELGLAVEWIPGGRCREIEPALHPSTRAGILAAHDREVDPRELSSALAEALVRAGGRLREGAEVSEVLLRGGRAVGVGLSGGEQIAAGSVVLAAGCWSGGIGGVPEPIAQAIRPVKGQIVRLRSRSGEPALVGHVIRTEEIYLVPRAGGGLVAGATVEEQGFDLALTAGGIYELLRAAQEAAPGVRELELVEASAGLRPGTPDNAPLLGPTSIERLVAATGHYR